MRGPQETTLTNTYFPLNRVAIILRYAKYRDGKSAFENWGKKTSEVHLIGKKNGSDTRTDITLTRSEFDPVARVLCTNATTEYILCGGRFYKSRHHRNAVFAHKAYDETMLETVWPHIVWDLPLLRKQIAARRIQRALSRDRRASKIVPDF